MDFWIDFPDLNVFLTALLNLFSRIYQIYTKMSEIYDAADTTNDLDFFRRNFGPDMPFIDLSFVVRLASLRYFPLISYFLSFCDFVRRHLSRISNALFTMLSSATHADVKVVIESYILVCQKWPYTYNLNMSGPP